MKPITSTLLLFALLLCVACGQQATKELADDPCENGGKMTDTIFCTIEIDSTTQIVFVKREVQPGYEEGSWDTLYGDPKLLREGKSFDLYKFPVGATVLDFAYHIHSNLGNQCTGGRINGKVVPIRYQLKSGDQVEILTSANQKPRQEWLSIVKSSRAKQKIRLALK